MRPYPDTLFGRLIAALLLVFLITGAVIGWLVMREREEVVYWGSESADVVEFLAEMTKEIATLPPAERLARVEALRRTPVTFAQGSDRPTPPRRRFDIAAAARSYEKQLQRELGRDYRVEVLPEAQLVNPPIPIGHRRFGGEGARRQGQRIRLDVFIRLPDQGQVTFRVPAPRPGPRCPWHAPAGSRPTQSGARGGRLRGPALGAATQGRAQARGARDRRGHPRCAPP